MAEADSTTTAPPTDAPADAEVTNGHQTDDADFDMSADDVLDGLGDVGGDDDDDDVEMPGTVTETDPATLEPGDGTAPADVTNGHQTEAEPEIAEPTIEPDEDEAQQQHRQQFAEAWQAFAQEFGKVEAAVNAADFDAVDGAAPALKALLSGFKLVSHRVATVEQQNAALRGQLAADRYWGAFDRKNAHLQPGAARGLYENLRESIAKDYGLKGEALDGAAQVAFRREVKSLSKKQTSTPAPPAQPKPAPAANNPATTQTRKPAATPAPKPAPARVTPAGGAVHRPATKPRTPEEEFDRKFAAAARNFLE